MRFKKIGAALLACAMCFGVFSTTAFAYVDESVATEEPAVEEKVPETEPEEPMLPLTPDGNLTLVDDAGSPTKSGKQFITAVTKNGNYFYIIIDRDDKGEETVHFLNQVDEADLMALTEDGEKAETPIVCTCTEKCQAGAVNTACPVCVKNLSECVGTEQQAAEPTEPENPEPEKKSNAGAILAVLLILAAGGGAAVYFLVLKPKQGKKVPADLDDFDLEDEEEYLTVDEETEEKNE